MAHNIRRYSKRRCCALVPLTCLIISAHGQDQWEDWGDEWDEPAAASEPRFPINGFVEATGSYRTRDSDVLAEEWVAQDLRGRIQTFYQGSGVMLSSKGEVFYDGVDHELHASNREAFVGFTPHSAVDVRVGRQILTWGTGDLVFLNDFFPKNWVAFFSGFDQQYLKAPSDALKVSGYSQWFNLDLVWSPEFDPDNFITGNKLVYFSPLAGEVVAAPPELQAEGPGTNLQDGELALRLYKTIRGIELAAYAYHGYYKTPEGFDPQRGTLYFPELSSLGASIRGNALGGISNLEYAYWDSRENSDGENPLLPNPESRFLVGYERELVRNLTASFQYYVEYTHDYDNLKARRPDPAQRPRKVRQLLTTRWTLSTQQSNLVYSAFVFYSPSDEDYYLIPNILYRLGDQWQFNAGANLLGGEHDYTQFGQLETNSNLYARAKFIF